MQFVFLLDQNKKPLDPCHPARARKLLGSGRAAVIRRYPFTIILKEKVQEQSTTQEYRVKIDPGSKTSGITIVREGDHQVLWAAEIQHRGQVIRAALLSRRAIRRGRRNRPGRTRPARFDNRRRREHWLPPSLESRLANIETWVGRIGVAVRVSAFSLELVKFDPQQMQNAEIAGAAYQQGELAGYEVREYLLEKWGRKCAYCGATDVPLEVEHITPRVRGGSNRVSNLTISCEPCNRKKNRQTAAEFGHPEIQAKAKQPLPDAAAVNAVRWELWRWLPVECGSGGRTKCNRIRQNLPKEHWLDAACVGISGPSVLIPAGLTPLLVKACGHGRRARCRVNCYGFPFAHAPKAKTFAGFQTGDLVQAKIPTGKHAGIHEGRIAIRFRPSFRLNGFDVHPKYLSIIQRSDGYAYSIGGLAADAPIPLPPEGGSPL